MVLTVKLPAWLEQGESVLVKQYCIVKMLFAISFLAHFRQERDRCGWREQIGMLELVEMVILV
jgi:hypothetical protein